jgi:hypothetical protein
MMASQQAQARAATVKSAAEMAAARAAEISKQLKGNDPEGVEEKRSPDRYFSVQYIFHLGSVVGMCVWTINVSMLADMSRHQIFFLASPSPIFSGSVSSILLVRKLMSMGSAGLEGGQDLLSTKSVESLHLSFDAV